MTHPPLTGPRLHRNRVGRPRSKQTTAKAAGIEPPLCGNHPATLPATSTATTTHHFQDSRSPAAPTPSSPHSCCGKHELPPRPSCQPADSNRAQARVNQEGTAPTARRNAGRGHPRTKEAPCRDSPEGSCCGPCCGAERAWHKTSRSASVGRGHLAGNDTPMAADPGRPLPPSSHPSAARRPLTSGGRPCPNWHAYSSSGPC
jgi:hypothetical protein